MMLNDGHTVIVDMTLNHSKKCMKKDQIIVSKSKCYVGQNHFAYVQNSHISVHSLLLVVSPAYGQQLGLGNMSRTT